MAHESFNENFKSMWESGSDVRLIWDMLETLYTVTNEKCLELSEKQGFYRSPGEIEKAIDVASEPMEKLYVEWVNSLWNKLILRVHLKVRDSLQLTFYSCNTANSYGCALSARAIIEHAALLQYFIDKIPWQEGRLIKKEDLLAFTKTIQNLTLGSRLDWDRLLSGDLRQMATSEKWDRPRSERLPHMAELLRSLDSKLFEEGRLYSRGQMRFIYGILCDVVHPNWGGDFIYSRQMYAPLSHERQFDEHFKLAATMFCLPVLELVRHVLEQGEALKGEELRVLI
jgi:hypothetical protein